MSPYMCQSMHVFDTVGARWVGVCGGGLGSGRGWVGFGWGGLGLGGWVDGWRWGGVGWVGGGGVVLGGLGHKYQYLIIYVLYGFVNTWTEMLFWWNFHREFMHSPLAPLT